MQNLFRTVSPRKSTFSADFRQVTTLPSAHLNDYTAYFDALPENAVLNEWGVARIFDPQSFSERRIAPLRNARSPKDILGYPLPDVDAEYRWLGLIDTVNSFKKAGYATTALFHATFFELICDLRGYERFLIDLYTEPEMAEALVSLVTDVRVKQAVGLAMAGVDFLRVGDNLGTQRCYAHVSTQVERDL